VLGFRLSDDVGDGTLLFLRCNADHHGIGITKGGEGLHHYAWEVETSAARAARRRAGEEQRQVPLGARAPRRRSNLFTYHLDPAGCVVEYYADLARSMTRPATGLEVGACPTIASPTFGVRVSPATSSSTPARSCRPRRSPPEVKPWSLVSFRTAAGGERAGVMFDGRLVDLPISPRSLLDLIDDWPEPRVSFGTFIR